MRSIFNSFILLLMALQLNAQVNLQATDECPYVRIQQSQLQVMAYASELRVLALQQGDTLMLRNYQADQPQTLYFSKPLLDRLNPVKVHVLTNKGSWLFSLQQVQRYNRKADSLESVKVPPVER